MICGWCGNASAGDPCTSCGHEDPDRPWRQRNVPPPIKSPARRLTAARRVIEADGRKATIEAMAEELGVSSRTVRRWREMSA